jgi:oligosaccharide repeat unit polymerase
MRYTIGHLMFMPQLQAVNDKCIALAFSLLILWQAYALRRFVGTWLFPACLYGLLWFGLTFMPLVVLFSVPVEPHALGFILLCLLAFTVSALFFDWKTAFRKNAQKINTVEVTYGSGFLKFTFHLSVAASLILITLNSYFQGISPHDLVFDLFASAQAYADMRYSDELKAALIERWSLVCVYLGATIGGLRSSCVAARERRHIIVLSFMPSILVAITQSAKWPFLLSIVLFYSGMLVYRISSGKLQLLEKGRISSLAVYAAIVFFIVTISFMSRGLFRFDDFDLVMSKLIAYFASYSCAHIYAFSDWFAFFIGGHSEIGYAHETVGHGFYTFATVFKMMGSQKVLPMGVYDDYYSYGELLTSNIFTIFRGLIMDFGLIGSVVFMFVVGLLFHGAFYFLLSRKRPVFTIAVFIFMMNFFISFGASTFGANIIYYVVFLLMWIVLYLNNKLTRQGRFSC